MSKKKRRRSRSRPTSQASAPPSDEFADEPVEDSEAETPTPRGLRTTASTSRTKGAVTTKPRGKDSSPPPRPRLGERMRAPSPFPTTRSSLGRGLLIVCGSSAILLIALLFVGAVWLGLVASGMEVFPRTMSEAAAVPPISTFFFDLVIPTSIFGLTVQAALITVVLTVARGVVMAVLVGMMLESLEFGRPSVVGFLQGLRATTGVLLMVAFNVVLLVGGNLLLVILGPIGQLAFPVVLAGSLYLLPFTPAIVVRGRFRGTEALRRSARAARMPGSRHILMVVMYFFFSLVVALFVPGGSIVTANPTLSTWAWVLGATVIHLVFLAAFCERWVAVEAQVPDAPPPLRRRTPAPRRRGLFSR